ncbi:hypothetical protein [Coprobacter secundus]|uniref:Uncharacterized protein n=1 Tax=Coprobacter secundus subsp. similis TaxID=2751153 RepID=A0A7G1HU87_9BACT|nr:hypothetical protein [Coprobacter secundus]BCI61728.1 hypothetical protein Cop2CBH44_00810 [Coprobacter secundus subsp. similis]CCY38771.1 unknown [Tannerella sp. CAG:118]
MGQRSAKFSRKRGFLFWCAFYVRYTWFSWGWYLSASGGCFWFEVAVRRRDTPPTPLERGVLDAAFCLIMSYLIGDEGVCYGEGRGWDVFAAVF